MPGQPVTVKLAEESVERGGGLRLYIRFWHQSPATTRSYAVDSSKTWTRYNRPQFAKSPDLPFPNDGTSITVVSPYGGPIFLGVGGEGVAAGGSISVTFENVVRHPQLNLGSVGQIPSFISSLSTNPVGYVNLKAPGLELHLRKDKLMAGFTSSVSSCNGPAITYNSTSAGMRKFLTDLFGTINSMYALIGIRQPGVAAARDGFSNNIKALADHLGLTEIYDDAINRAPSTTVHFVYDEVAVCADSGCAQREMSIALRPIGWEEHHTVGYQWMQRKYSSLLFVRPSDVNFFGRYDTPDGKPFPNMFPSNAVYAFYRKALGYNGKLTVWSGTEHTKNVWSMMQSAKLELTRGGTYVAVSAECSSTRATSSYKPADQAELVFNAVFNSDFGGKRLAGQTFDNWWEYQAQRNSHYWQIAIAASGITMADGATVLQDGFEVFSIVFALWRTIEYYVAQDQFMNHRVRLGFSLYEQISTLAGASDDLRSMPGNDFLLVALSVVTKRDWRTWFRARGIKYSDTAEAQVDDHLATGRVTGRISTAIGILDNDEPPYPMYDIPKVPVDGVSEWTDGFNPGQCLLDGTQNRQSRTTSKTTTKTRTTSNTRSRTTRTYGPTETAEVAMGAIVGSAGDVSTIELSIPPACASSSCGIQAYIGIAEGNPEGWLGVRQSSIGSVVRIADVWAEDIASRADSTSAMLTFNTSLVPKISATCSPSAFQIGECYLVMAFLDPRDSFLGSVGLFVDTTPTFSGSGVQYRVARAMVSGDSAWATSTEIKADITTRWAANLASGNAIRTSIFASLDEIGWNPTHDSVLLTINDPEVLTPLVLTNWDFLPDVASNSPSVLAAAGYASLVPNGGRVVVFGGNPFHDINTLSTTGGWGSAQLTDFLKNVVAWATGDSSASASPNFVLAHLSNDYWAQVRRKGFYTTEREINERMLSVPASHSMTEPCSTTSLRCTPDR